MAERNWAGFRTVVDGLEGLWDGATKEWRAAQERQLQMEQRQAELRRQAAQPAVDAGRRIANDAASATSRAVHSVANSRAATVGAALLQDKRGGLPENGPFDLHAADRRMGETEDLIRQNLDAGRASGSPEAMAGAWPAAFGQWVGNVWPTGKWDDKRHGASEGQGNFNYGASAAALGLPKEVALRGAGLAQRFGAAWDAMTGMPVEDLRWRAGWLTSPYGDDPRDQPPISAGYDYGRRRYRNP